MHHLTLEEIARLVDEPPTDIEANHLVACERCAAELEGMRAQVTGLARLTDPLIPAAVDAAVRDVVRREVESAGRVSRASGSWIRIAASVAIFVIGAATGTFVIAPATSAISTIGEPPGRYGDVMDPAGRLAAAEADYLEALASYARATQTSDGLDPLNRLAALEGIVLTTRAALRDAPADPVINTYHLAALGERDALLRQIADATVEDEWF